MSASFFSVFFLFYRICPSPFYCMHCCNICSQSLVKKLLILLHETKHDETQKKKSWMFKSNLKHFRQSSMSRLLVLCSHYKTHCSMLFKFWFVKDPMQFAFKYLASDFHVHMRAIWEGMHVHQIPVTCIICINNGRKHHNCGSMFKWESWLRWIEFRTEADVVVIGDI